MSSASEHIAGWQAAGLLDPETADRLRAADAERARIRADGRVGGVRIADVRPERHGGRGLRLSRGRLPCRGLGRIHGHDRRHDGRPGDDARDPRSAGRRRPDRGRAAPPDGRREAVAVGRRHPAGRPRLRLERRARVALGQRGRVAARGRPRVGSRPAHRGGVPAAPSVSADPGRHPRLADRPRRGRAGLVAGDDLPGGLLGCGHRDPVRSRSDHPRHRRRGVVAGHRSGDGPARSRRGARQREPGRSDGREPRGDHPVLGRTRRGHRPRERGQPVGADSRRGLRARSRADHRRHRADHPVRRPGGARVPARRDLVHLRGCARPGGGPDRLQPVLPGGLDVGGADRRGSDPARRRSRGGSAAKAGRSRGSGWTAGIRRTRARSSGSGTSPDSSAPAPEAT